MKKIAYLRGIYSLDFKLKAKFSFNNINVSTISETQLKIYMPPEEEGPSVKHGIKIPKAKERKSRHGYLMIDATCELEEYDSFGEG